MNAFEAVCVQAAAEQWCWNLACTTCGHGVFRWALRALASGVDPRSAAWTIRWGPDVTFSELQQGNGPLPSPGAWPLDVQISLQDIAVTSKLAFLREHVRFPDWLGYVGILLRYTEGAERRNRRLSTALVPQFLELVPPNSRANLMLRDIVDTTGHLQWQALEIIEHSLDSVSR